MAVTFDAVGPSSAGTGGSTSPLTWSHTNSGNAIIVGVTCFDGTANNVTAVTYGGVALNFLGYVAADNAGPGGVAMYGLVSASLPAGANTVSVSFSVANNHNAGSISLAGASSLGTPVTAFASASSITASVPSTTTGGMVVSAVSFGSPNTFSATSPNVLRWAHNSSGNSGADNGAGGTEPSAGGGAATSVAWSNTTSDFWGLVAVEVLPPSSTPKSDSEASGAGADGTEVISLADARRWL
jgi:hypothetical protein